MSIDIDLIRRVRGRIDPAFLNSPLLRPTALGEALGCSLALKVETLNPIRSFKGRGTEALMDSLSPAPRHVVATSSGNFGQGLAYAATRRGVTCTIFSGVNDNPLKIDAMRKLGAEVRLVADGVDSKAEARRHAEAIGALLVEDGAHPEIAAGAGTLAMELLEAFPQPEIAVVQIGDGALISGVGSWIRAMSPTTRIIGVTAAGAPAMRVSLEQGQSVRIACETIADGLAIQRPVPSALGEIRAVVDAVIEVEEDAIIDGVALLLKAGIMAEPSAAVGVAAIMRNAETFRGRSVAAIVTGSNIRPELLREAVRRDR
ncbi:MAG: threonine/serine dehydratase [Rhizobiaceae bacterium]